MLSVDKSLIVSQTAQILEYRKWANEIPYLHFDTGWRVKIIPPFGGAVARFAVHNPLNGNHVSVYFDAYSELGCVD